MKTKFFNVTANILLSTLIGVCGVGCLSTGFGFPVGMQLTVSLSLAVAAAICLLHGKRFGWLVYPAVIAVWAVLIVRFDGYTQLLTICSAMYQQWADACNWEIPQLLAEREWIDPPLGAALWASFLSLIAANALSRQRTLFAIIAVLLAVAPCLVITFTVPDPIWLVLIFLCIGLLVITASVRKGSIRDGVRLLAMALVPVALYVAIIFVCNPEEEYDAYKAKTWMEFLEELQERLGIPDIIQLSWWISDEPTEPTEPIVVEPNVLDLTTVGPLEPDDTVVMEICTDYTGTLYLRGTSYANYTGTEWNNTTKAAFYAPEDFLSSEQYTISLETTEALPQYYLPYYCLDDIFLDDGISNNESADTSYSYTYQHMTDYWHQTWQDSHPTAFIVEFYDGSFYTNLRQHNSSFYSILPYRAELTANQILIQIGIKDDMPVLQAVNIIADYVRNWAAYSLESAAMPAEQADFASWFLTESNTGYSIHYATAATVLLRAADIPARLVTGYVVDAEADTQTTVTADMAHAWVEYYLNDIGWIVLEVTPGFDPDSTPSGAVGNISYSEQADETDSEQSAENNHEANSGNSSNSSSDGSGSSSGTGSSDNSGSSGDSGSSSGSGGSGGGTLSEPETVDLSRLGPMTSGGFIPDAGPLMNICADFTGSLYLRGKNYGDYSGLTWSGCSNREVFGIDSAYLSGESCTVSLETACSANLYYHPYYEKFPGIVLNDGAYSADHIPSSYTFSCRNMVDQWQQLWEKEHGAYTIGYMKSYATKMDQYTQLPSETLSGAQKILQQIGITEDTPYLQAAQMICNYVKTSAAYDLNTPTMPGDRTDFALWFLTESDTGYCTHFATAATVLLRAANIPARLVGGYLVQVEAGVDATVGSVHAHAWTEVYVPDVGWIVVDATPSNAGSNTDDQDETVPTETEPTETTAPAETDTSEGITPEQDLSGSVGDTDTSTSLPDHAEDREPINLFPVLACLGIVAVVLLQWWLRLRWKRAWMQRGSPNTRALHCWIETQRIAKLLRTDPPQELYGLALKAKYSQYTITDVELQKFEDFFSSSTHQFEQLPVYRRILYRIIFAAY